MAQPRKFIVHEADGQITKYYGFNRQFDSPHIAAIFEEEDTISKWACDDPEGLVALCRYYEMNPEYRGKFLNAHRVDN